MHNKTRKNSPREKKQKPNYHGTLKNKATKITKTDTIAVPWAEAFATVNTACLPVAKLMAMVRPEQYAFSLSYSKPKSTARPRESAHLTAKHSPWLAGLMIQLPPIILKLCVAGFVGFFVSLVFGLDSRCGREGETSWRSCRQDKKKKADEASCAVKRLKGFD